MNLFTSAKAAANSAVTATKSVLPKEVNSTSTMNSTADALHMSIATLQEAMISEKLTGEITAGVTIMGICLKTSAAINDLSAPGPAYNPSLGKALYGYELVVKGTKKLICQAILLATRLRELGYRDEANVDVGLSLSMGSMFAIDLSIASSIEQILRDKTSTEIERIRILSEAEEKVGEEKE